MDDEQEETSDRAKLQSQWEKEIALYDRLSDGWHKQGKKIVKRYKDQRDDNDSGRRFNVLWSNVQTLLPALYARNPKPQIERRWKDQDDAVGDKAAEVLERCVEYFIVETAFYDNVRNAVLDRLLPGRGTLWIRYNLGEELTDDESDGVTTEEVLPDYVHWQDFGHTQSRTWDECRAVWRIAYLTREQLRKRFPDDADRIPLTWGGPEEEKEPKASEDKKGRIYEIWDKDTKRVIWLCRELEEVLDIKDDPLKLAGFWPTPKPMLSTVGNDTIIPVPDYREYQDQASELDSLTARIYSLSKSIKAAGVYDSSQQGLSDLLDDGLENKLVPVESWAAFAEKGGLVGGIQLLPMKDLAQTLLTLYEARDKAKADLYEITGMADILRGVSDPQETAAAQGIKSRFATLRLSDAQSDVQRFCRDLVSIMAQIIGNLFDLEQIKELSGVKLLSAAEKQAVAMQMQQWQQQQAQQGQPQQPPPVPKPVLDLMDEPSWDDVQALMRNRIARMFRIDVETDSTVMQDEEADKESRTQFVEASDKLLQTTLQVVDQVPPLAPLMTHILKYAIRGFPQSRDLLSEFEKAAQTLEKMAENPPQKPDPEQVKAQAQMQIEQAKLQAGAQADQQKLQMQAQVAQMEVASKEKLAQFQAQLDAENDKREADLRAAADQAKAQADAQVKMLEIQHQGRIEELKAANAMEIEKLRSATQIQIEEMKLGHSAEQAEKDRDVERKKLSKEATE